MCQIVTTVRANKSDVVACNLQEEQSKLLTLKLHKKLKTVLSKIIVTQRTQVMIERQ